MAGASTENLFTTPLNDTHIAWGGRMVGFAGYSMPVQYKGLIAEHEHTRSAASLFDVSHMGQVVVTGPDHETTARALETLMPGDLVGLKPGEMRYTLLLNDKGCIEDDLIVTRPGEEGTDGMLMIVFNAGRKDHDVAILRENLDPSLKIETFWDKALVALQGPKAADVLARYCDLPSKLSFMNAAATTIEGMDVYVSRSGYTGEDGFELSVDANNAVKLAELLVSNDEVEPAGLGARDSLRLEAGLCLYGHDMDDQRDPISAGLIFAIGKGRRVEGGFPGASAIQKIIKDGAREKRSGIRFEGRMPVREGAEIVDADGNKIGVVTSGTFGPTIGAPVAFAYVPAELAKIGTELTATVRGKAVKGVVEKLPFTPANYVRL
ncbi:glycine cleavage system aminomethyltransferase GcvT [Maritalea sp.]|uniref:glycine cleavage system aminomethyltransferase GcvT n=1 Tax=Maritalea sp. TaxID=2003361 RepID=UPI003EF225AE